VGLGVALTVTVVVIAAAGVRAIPATSGVPANWQVAACDVGQGDAMVIRSGPSSAVMIDVGPAGTAAADCLDRLAVTHLDLLVLTHFHADHVGGLPPVLSDVSVAQAFVSGLDVPAAGSRHTRDALTGAGVSIQVPVPGARGAVGEGQWEVSWQVLSADTGGGGASGSEEGDGANDASVILDLASTGPGGSVTIAALADVEQDGQDVLATQWRSEAIGAVDVVKMAHHGSASQSGRLAALLHPSVALISVGADNTYGHPTDKAMTMYANLGTKEVRTDRCGTAILVIRQSKIALACTN
jgi:competence protein ComEC